MKLNQQQCEAFADILVLAMCIDGHFSLLEEEAIQQELSNIGWNENLSPDLHLSSSIARARDVAGSTDAVTAYLEALVPVIGEPAIARFVVEETVKLLDSDGSNDDEGTFLFQLKSVLKI